MKSKVMLLGCLLAAGCSTNYRYPNWEYVRLEFAVPDTSCVYKIQETCSQAGNHCMDWYKQRATTFGANTVVITSKENQQFFAASGFTGNAKGGEVSSSIAEYYACSGPKNIAPAPKN